METNPFENQKPKQEELFVSIDIAQEKDWQDYRDLKLEATKHKEDIEMLGMDEERIKSLQNKKEDDWKKVVAPDNLKFVLLVRNGQNTIGTTSAKSENEHGVWYIYDTYVKKEFRNRRVGQAQLAVCLDEIILRDGEKATMLVKKKNEIQLGLVDKFGFKIIRNTKSGEGFALELDLKNPEVIKKINETLDAG